MNTQENNGQQHKKALMCATVASMIGQFNMANIQILLNLGYEVHVACNFLDRSVWTEERVEEFRKQLDDLGVKYFQIEFARSPKYVGKLAESYKEIKELLFHEKYTLVHVHTPVAAAEVRLAAKDYNDAIERRVKEGKKAPGRLRVIYTAHGFHFYDGAPKKNWILFYPVEKELSRITDVLITINNEDYNRAKNHFFAKKTVKIPGVGVDTAKFETCHVDKTAKREEFGIPHDGFVLLSVGELSDRKNQRVVIEAMKKLKEASPADYEHIYYLAVGQGELKDEYENLIDSYGLEAHVKLLGFRSDIGELCETVDCFVHPSVREGLGIAPLEAMATGLPLISSYVNGIRDYTEDEKSGVCITDPTSVDAMEAAIEKMYQNPGFRESCGAWNYDEAKKFDINRTDEIMTEIYRGGYAHLEALLKRWEIRSELGIPKAGYLLISVGELSTRKNQIVVLKALNEIRISQPKIFGSIYYILVGQGELKQSYEDYINDHELGEHVKLLGFRSDIPDLLHASELFVFPSIQEGLPVALMEAMASGIDVICSKIRGNVDLIDKGLFDSYDANGIKKLIVESIENKDIRNSHNIAMMKKYTIEQVKIDMMKIYKGL